MPLIGCHWVIDRPDSVSRVMPPTTTMAITSSATASSQCTSAWMRAAALVWRAARPRAC